MGNAFCQSFIFIGCLMGCGCALHAQERTPDFKVIGFFTAENDQAHISFVHEANELQNRLILDGLLWLGKGKNQQDRP